jgi:hypothetical protein
LSNTYCKRQLSTVIHHLSFTLSFTSGIVWTGPKRASRSLQRIAWNYKVLTNSLEIPLKEFFQNQLEYLPPNSKYENIYATLNVHTYPTPREHKWLKHFKFSNYNVRASEHRLDSKEIANRGY